VLERLSKLVMVMALALSIGLHWAILQSVAWTSMLVDNLRSASLTVAIGRTFDSKRPCNLCKAIDQAKQTAKKTEFSSYDNKLEFVSASSVFIFTAPSDFRKLSSRDGFVRGLTRQPPSPPPRSLLA
jgi:hypothetical protein